MREHCLFATQVEGAEYDLLPALLTSGFGCQLDLLIIEFHGPKMKNQTWPEGLEASMIWLLKRCGVIVCMDTTLNIGGRDNYHCESGP